MKSGGTVVLTLNHSAKEEFKASALLHPLMLSWAEESIDPLAPGSNENPLRGAWADTRNTAARYYPVAALAQGLVCHLDPCSSLHLSKKKP